MKQITVLLVEDHEVVRQGLRALIQTQQNLQVVGEASDGREAVQLARELRPEVVLMDISIPELNGLEATRQIRRFARETKILVLSSYDDLECINEMTEAGAAGFLSKRSAANHLAEAIYAVRTGKCFYGPEIAKRLKERDAALARDGRREGNPFSLTNRQEEVLQLISSGLSNKEMASQLGISIKTVEKHRQSVMDILNIHETAGLTRYALKRGLVPERVAIKSQTSVLEPVL